MPERGVSRRVAVKFDEVGADGRLAKAAAERAVVEAQMDEPTDAPTRSTVSVLAEVEIEIIATTPALPEKSPSNALAQAWGN
jgi:hypothetical protein